MKRVIGLLLFLLVIGVMAFACAEKVETFTSGDYKYTLNEDGSAVISKYSGKEANLVIPSELDGHPVTTIGNCAFSCCFNLTSVTIPDSVTTVRDLAFSECWYLTSIMIPDSVTSIGNEAFFNCWSLTYVTIPDSVTDIGANPWTNCSSLTTINVSPRHPSLAVINGALYSKADKRLVWVPASTEGGVQIPQGIKTIGDKAFFSCGRLTSVTIPDSVTTIGNGAFEFCDSLLSVSVPDSVSTIGDEAFSYCTYLFSFDIPDSVTSIGNYAFSWCRNLNLVIIPDSVTDIGANPWESCSYLETVSVSPGNPAFEVIEGALYNKTGRRLVCVPANMKGHFEIQQGTLIIDEGAFSGCGDLTSVMIPDSVTAICDNAFAGCSSLTSVTIPESVTTIGFEAFIGCESLTSITIPASVTTIDIWAFPNNINLIITVSRDSYAEQYCINNELNYQFPNSLDWLNN